MSTWRMLQPMGKEEFINQKNALHPNRQAVNNAGGYSYTVDDETRVLRFLIMGMETGTYYQAPIEIKRESIQSIDRLVINGKGPDVVKLISSVSVNNRACKQDYCIYALAVCARCNDLDTKKAAYNEISNVCRIPTHLFQFISYCEKESAGTGWGRAHRRSIEAWYNNYRDDTLKLAMQVTKFRKRHDWEHKDVLRLSHMKPESVNLGLIVKYIIKGLDEAKKHQNSLTPEDKGKADKLMKYLEAVDQASFCKDQDEMVQLIRDFRLVREHVPTPLLKSVPVWRALLDYMPMNAMIRNLGKMGSMQMLSQDSEEEKIVIKRLLDKEWLHKSRVHPFTVLVAMNTYKTGSGDRGKLCWPRNQRIVDCMEKAYYSCFSNVDPTGKRYLLAVDVSGSMNTPIIGSSSVTARDGAAAMMMLTAKTEENFQVVAFSNGVTPMNITKEDTLAKVIDRCNALPFSGTDCSAPMFYAMEKRLNIDVFVVYTDSETFFGKMHPSQALEQYRKWSEIRDARLIVVGMASNGFSIADPDDRYMMDVVGFDTEAPIAMRAFITNYGDTESKEPME